MLIGLCFSKDQPREAMKSNNQAYMCVKNSRFCVPGQGKQDIDFATSRPRAAVREPQEDLRCAAGIYVKHGERFY